ncbi:MAG: DJ-1/PfpI family protein, partial [Pseudomonadota bacterium]
MSISGKKIAVLLAEGFEDHELHEPVAALKEAGAEVTLFGLHEEDARGVTGKHGSTARADAVIDEADADRFDALLIPGGRGPAILRQDE